MSIDPEQPTATHSRAAGQRGPVPRFVLVLGGARSGKSTFAERLATTSGRSVAFIATATASDDEMRQRIAQHRASRPVGWQTIEEPLDLALAVRRAGTLADVLLLDCITIWLSNWMAREGHIRHHALLPEGKLQDDDALSAVDALLDVVASLPANKTLIAITNEVGLGVVPMHPLGRAYRDTLGYVNQRLAGAADRVYLMLAGMAVDIKRLHEEATICSGSSCIAENPGSCEDQCSSTDDLEHREPPAGAEEAVADGPNGDQLDRDDDIGDDQCQVEIGDKEGKGRDGTVHEPSQAWLHYP